MKERLLEFLRKENKSSAQLAEEIGVQASGISHILSGRNNPSLDFILRMLEKYTFISTEWLLFGKGTMYREPKMQSLFDFSQSDNDGSQVKPLNETSKQMVNIQDVAKNKRQEESTFPERNVPSEVVRIVWFYDDNSFVEYFPK